jgi:phage I-like protein
MGVDRFTVAAAAEILGVSQDAVRKRVKRDTIQHGKDDGRIFVLLDANKNRPKTDQDAGRVEMVEVLRDEISHLRRESERKDTIILSLSQSNAEQARTIRAIEAPATNEQPQDVAQDDGEDSGKGTAPQETQRASSRRSLWSRIFDR